MGGQSTNKFLMCVVIILSGYLPASSQVMDSTAQIIKRLSNPLVMDSGIAVKNKSEWFEDRHPELLNFFRNEVYGKVPEKPAAMSFELIESDSLVLNGVATRKQVDVLFEGGVVGQKMTILPYLPNKQSEVVPIFLGLNFNGNQTIIADKNILLTDAWVNNKSIGVVENKSMEDSRGTAASQWPLELILKNGFGVATIHAGDIAPDFKEGYKQEIQLNYPELQYKPDNFSTMGAWAWRLSRAMDYLETDAQIDAHKVILFGTSRLGKAALWAGATDDRFAMVVSNESGAGGAKLYHHTYNEDIAQISRVFPHGYSTNFQKYAGRDNQLPFDQHLMMSLIAPRPLLIASTTEAYVCDPYGEFLGALATSPVYEFLGEKPLPINAYPLENTPAYGRIGYYVRSGKHNILQYDWEQFFAFAKANLN